MIVYPTSLRRPDHFIVIGNPGGRRVELFQAALAELRLPQAQIISYLDLLSGKVALPQSVRQGAVVRIESPGKDFEVERALIAAGADVDDGDQRFDRISRREAESLSFDKGLILYSRQWYLGYRATLRTIERQLAECPPHRLMNSPAEIALMFDKIGCHQSLGSRGIPTARGLGSVNSFDELHERMREQNCHRVFVKLAYGSSGSGVVAYQTDGRRHHATTTVEMARSNVELRLYNSRRIRVYQDWREIAELMDALCRHQVHVEQWIPKAGFDNRTFDLRVVVIAGRACHTVARLSRTPITNLHLLNERGASDAVREIAGQQAWEAAMRDCERAMECFPGSLYAGIDLMFTPDYRRHAVIEVNAFGDLLPGVFWQGLETYAAELLLCPNRDTPMAFASGPGVEIVTIKGETL
jgi:glutathione synthase/RimK-type ligase-like ATP-grasp enzyme